MHRSRRGAATFSVTLRDLLIVSYAVPAERARPHVPDALPLDTYPGPDGTRLAFLQTTCAFSENFHWSPLAGKGLSYHQITYRILTRRGGRRGAFVLRTVVSTTSALVLGRAVARQTDDANFFVHVPGDPGQKRYEVYTARAVGERGQTALDVRGLPEDAPLPAAPFADRNEMIFFLTQREENTFEAAAGGTGLIPVEHKPMRPVFADLVAARLSLWTDLGLLFPDELLRPVAVLIQPSVVLTAHPPRLVR